MHKPQFKRTLILASIFENLSLLSHEKNIAKTAFPSYVLIIFTYFEGINLISRANLTVTDICVEILRPDLFTFLESNSGSNESLELWKVSLTLFYFYIFRYCMQALVKTMLK